MNDPIYGTNRMTADNRPHSTGFGTPISASPVPHTMPNPVLTPSCDRKYRLSRRAASSIAIVVRCRSPAPNNRIIRSRRSSNCSSMNIATASTMPNVAMGDSTGLR